jgi:hypothetical protein
MKKLLAIAAMSAMASLGVQSAQAGTWDVLCIKQGPNRLTVAPLRVLNPASNVAPPANALYPIPARSIPTQAKVAEMSDVVGDMNFISLGFGGSIVLVYSDKFGAAPGVNNDVTVYETTWGDPNCSPAVSEAAWVQFSQDGVNWTAPQAACHNGSFDIAPLTWGKYVKITDKTPNINARGDGTDAYDVDGIKVATDYTEQTVNPLCDHVQGVASQYVGALGNFPGRGIVNARKSFANANINDPSFTPAQFINPALREASGWYNFWSIGFGGHACFQLPYSVFDAPGPDFRMFETTWNNQPCPNYPEKVLISVSADGVIWGPATLLCKDGTYDIAGAFPVVNYIKFVDATNPADFGAGADSYDIDNIFILQNPPGSTAPDVCGSPVGGRRAVPEFDNVIGEGGVPEEMFPLEIVGSNVVSDKITFTATIADPSEYTYSIRNHTGQEVYNGVMEGGLYDKPTVDVSTSKLASGVYFLTLTSATGKETVKFIKK